MRDLEEIFEQITAELKKVGRVAKLPGGVVLVGGGAELRGIADYAKQALSLSARVGKPTGLGGVGEEVANPSYAVAVGLMLSDLVTGASASEIGESKKGAKNGSLLQSITGKITGMFSKPRS